MSLSRYQYGIWHEKASPAELFFDYHHAARRIPSGQERASRRPRRPAADRALCGPAHLLTRLVWRVRPVDVGVLHCSWRVKRFLTQEVMDVYG
jgi:hypothetical protein